jgi:hypothetical protein
MPSISLADSSGWSRKGSNGNTLKSGREEEVKGGDRRRGREDYEELDRLLKEADGFLKNEDPREANEALKKAGVKAASMWSETGESMQPGHTRRLIGLLLEVQEDLRRSGLSSPDTLRKDLRELRSRFRLEACRDAGETGVEG